MSVHQDDGQIANPNLRTGDQPCDHRKSSEAIFPGELVADFDFDYDMGFLSDGDFATDTRYHRKRRNGVESTFTELTSRLGSRMPTIKRWRSSRRVNLRTSPTTALSLENVLSRAPSISLTSSRSASNHHLPEPAPVTTMQPNMSYYDISDRSDTGLGIDMFPEDHNPSSLEDLERDRAMATTPLLPPLLIDAMAKPARESPLQSPKISSSPTFDGPLSPGLGSSQFARPPLSSRPSTSSLRNGSSSTELPLPLPAILQEHDEWSDRLGHANFTITPQPYELETFSTEAIAKFRNDWDLARVNYTKHLVRTGENYGQTSKIYALTEAKWAEAESRWMTTFEEIVRNTPLSPSGGSASVSRNQSRGRGRGRSSSSNAAALARLPMQDDIFADLEWRRLDDCLPSAVPQMLESLDADGKFPGRGDEDIVGPMQRDSVMARARSEDPKGRFWKNLADKVGLRK